jgi:CheY-like chemotaxis protein
LSKHKDVIISDYNKIKQVYAILLDNALKFTEKGKIEVGYNIKSTNYIDFYVSDTGLGIPKESKELVFERFRQVDQSITRKYEGLGLGLSIADGLVKQLGGSMTLVSQLHQGSKFTFSLPVKYSQKIHSADEDNFSEVNLSGKTILVAEDDMTNFLLVKEFLIDTNANLEHAEDGLEAVNYCKNNKVDLVIMDIKMPVLDGIGALEKIRDIKPDVPIIAFTAHAYENDKKRLLQKGFDEYISKPVKQGELRKLVGKSI